MEKCAVIRAGFVSGAVLLGVALTVAIARPSWSGSVRCSAGGETAAALEAQPEAPVALRGEGRIACRPGAEATLGAEVPGRVLSVAVREGTRVRSGDVLVEIEACETRAALDEARARVAEAIAQQRFCESDVARARALKTRAAVSGEAVDRAERDLALAIAGHDAAVAVEERLEAALEKSRVRAPFDGTVIARHVEPGEVVAPGSRLLTVADLASVRVEAEVDEFDAGRLAIGASVRVSAEGFEGRSWAGRVDEIPDSVVPRRIRPQDPASPSDTRVLIVKVALLEATPLKLGQRVEVAITGEAAKSTSVARGGP